MLVQLGEFGASGDALNEDRSPEMLGRLRDRLREKYPGEHPVLVLYSSGPPEYRSEGRRIALSKLADENSAAPPLLSFTAARLAKTGESELSKAQVPLARYVDATGL